MVSRLLSEIVFSILLGIVFTIMIVLIGSDNSRKKITKSVFEQIESDPSRKMRCHLMKPISEKYLECLTCGKMNKSIACSDSCAKVILLK